MSTPSDLIVERNGPVMRVTFNRPDSLNAFTPQMLTTATQAVEAAGDDRDVRVVVVTGAGRAFSSGADLSARADPEYQGGPATIKGVNGLVRALRTVPKPVVAAVNGPAAGGGCSVSLAADFIVARESAYFLLAFANVGLMPDGGATALVPAAIGRVRATRMAMLAERIPAPLAVEWGLITQAVPDDSLDSCVDLLTTRLAKGPTAAYAQTKHAFSAATIAQLDQAFAVETAGQSLLTGTADFAEGLAAFTQKRTPDFSGN
ncbi:enoyl-CoA hydratase-related protein [Streptomyces sp. NPDC005077]|uniref:enoyl-CoA hydratase-related protein n=1 Tax=Streptomyces sp. NPDC005077 TaxID=3154292 RepID=UPI0033B16AF9